MIKGPQPSLGSNEPSSTKTILEVIAVVIGTPKSVVSIAEKELTVGEFTVTVEPD